MMTSFFSGMSVVMEEATLPLQLADSVLAGGGSVVVEEDEEGTSDGGTANGLRDCRL